MSFKDITESKQTGNPKFSCHATLSKGNHRFNGIAMKMLLFEPDSSQSFRPRVTHREQSSKVTVVSYESLLLPEKTPGSGLMEWPDQCVGIS